MLTILNSEGKTELLSEEVYEVVAQPNSACCLQIGELVRLISGMDGSGVPGHHWEDGYVTVCSITAKTAEYIGLKRDEIRLVDY